MRVFQQPRYTLTYLEISLLRFISQRTHGPFCEMLQLGSPFHLVKRFFVSVFAFRADIKTEFQLLELLNEEEKKLYLSQPRIDRIHSVRNAKCVLSDPSGPFQPSHVIAAALHDVGKAESNLGILGRVSATTLQKILPMDIIRSWCRKDGLRKRIHSYCVHSELGAELLAKAGSAPIVVSWALQHHNEEDNTEIPQDVLAVLKRADRS